MATKTLMSLEEFERLPDDGMLHELDEGKVIEMAAPKSRHTRIGQKIHNALTGPVRESRTGELYTEAGYLLTSDPPTIRQPDVSFLSARRVNETGAEDYFQGAPELAVEIVSPSESAEDLDRKVSQYLASGATLVWVVYPKTRTIHVFRAGGSVTVLNENDTLEAPELFPGWRARVADLFV